MEFVMLRNVFLLQTHVYGHFSGLTKSAVSILAGALMVTGIAYAELVNVNIVASL